MKTLYKVISAGFIGFIIGYFHAKKESEQEYAPIVETLKEKLRKAIKIMREDEEWVQEAFGPVTSNDKDREELLHYEV